MLGYMNTAALRATLEGSRVMFFSRTKDRLWEKGGTSGHPRPLGRMCGLRSGRVTNYPNKVETFPSTIWPGSPV
jgi:Phosphoribosyl-AMP cyclohydrolase